jgi:hypothetical protein
VQFGAVRELGRLGEYRLGQGRLVGSGCKLCKSAIVLICSYDWWKCNKSIHLIQNPHLLVT